MWIRIKRILSNKDLMLRISFTLFVLLLLRIVSHIPVPLLDVESLTSLFSNSGSFFSLLNSFSGRSLQRFSILSLGITPYITASIIVQLLVMVIPRIKEWSEEGENGKVKMNKVTRYLALFVAFIQSLALILGASTGPGNLFYYSYQGSELMANLYMTICMTTGSAIAIWFADLITTRGVGNGSSILITAGIIISIPITFETLIDRYIYNNSAAIQYFYFVLIVLLFISILLGVVFMETSIRKVPIQYANRREDTGANIPIKINTPNVMPVIFASTILSIPLTIAGFLPGSSDGGSKYWINQVFGYNNPIGYLLYVILIVIFSFFYAFLTVDPTKLTENLSKSNAFIPGIRPGEETKVYISKVLFKSNVIGTVYLIFLASIPIFVSAIFGFQGVAAQNITIGGTSILIVVGVAIETTKQVEADAGQGDYHGVLG